MNYDSKMLIALGVSSLIATAATADITGFVYQDVKQVSAADFAGQPDFDGTVIDLWMEFDDSADILLNTFNFNDVNLGMTYWQSYPGAGWTPNNLGIPFETDALKFADSYVSIGDDNGGVQVASNGTGLDPNFGGNTAAGPGANAGWYNSDPGNPIGAVVATSHTETGLGVFIGRFSMNGGSFDMAGGTGDATWNQGLGTDGAQGSFEIVPVPAPGALALIGMAGLAGRRRRRN